MTIGALVYGNVIFGGFGSLGASLISGNAVYGVIESGLGGVSPNFRPFIYLRETTNYQIPTYTYNAPKISRTDEKSSVTIIENQLIGISRAHSYFQGAVTFQGYFQEQSNISGIPNLNVQLSGIEAYINNIYVGARPDTYAWSGLSSAGTNYLWLSLVEQNNQNNGYLSSRQFRDFECRSTSTVDQPVGPEGSVLVATYNVSGGGVNVLPAQRSPFTLVGDHVADNDKPHGNPLYVVNITCSGLEVMGQAVWNYNAAHGAPSGIPFSDVKYLNNLTITQNTTIVTSGLLGNIQSGLGGLFTSGLPNLWATNATIATLTVLGTGTALRFNGTNYVQIGVPTTTSMTIEAWIRTTDTEGVSTWPWWDGKGIVDGEMAGFTNDFGMSLTGGNVAFGIGNPDTTIHSQNVADGNWHHAAGTWNSSTGAMILYIDGIQVATGAGPTGARTATTNLKIGAIRTLTSDPLGVPQYFVGDIDDVRIWSVVRTGAQIAANYQSALTLPQTGLAAYLKFDDLPNSNPLSDSTGNGWNGTPVGNPSTIAGVFSTVQQFGNSLFRKPVVITSGSTIDGIQLSLVKALVNNANVSGLPVIHSHGLNDQPYTSILLSPKYPGMTTSPIYSGTTISNRFILGQDFGAGGSSLRHYSSANSDTDNLYLRAYVPTYFNKLESINIQNRVDSGNGPILLKIRDCLGNIQTPVLGSSMASGIGLNICYVSGLSQSGFGQNSPFDLEFTFSSISGCSHYLGDIGISFLAQNP